MAQELRLKEIKIKGFRGYGKEEKRLDLSSPVVILFGGNRSGKSSTTNAVEWALYGREVTGKKIGIAERNRWRTRNRNCDSVKVELVLESDKGDIHIFREMGKTRKRSGEPFYYVDENGEKFEDQELLWSLLDMDARDFMSSAYLHQEVVRDIVVSVPSVREEALNRLLGVSGLRNLFNSLKGVSRTGYEKDVDEIYRNLQNNIQARSAAYQDTVEDSYAKGEKRGMGKGEFTKEGFNKRCSLAAGLVNKLAGKAGLEGIEARPPENASDFPEFEEEIKSAVRRLRGENPGAVARSALVEEKGRLEGTLAAYRDKLGRVRELREKRGRLEKEGGLNDLVEKRAALVEERGKVAEELGRINARLPVIEATIAYLGKLEDKTSTAACPACEQDIVPGEVLSRLRDVKGGMGDDARELSGRSQKLAEDISSLDKAIEDLRKVIERDLPRAAEEVDESREEIGEILKRSIDAGEDPETLANNRLKRIEEELEGALGILRQYNEDLDKAEDALQEARLIGDLLVAQKKIEVINAITDSREWKEMDEARDRLNMELEGVSTVKDAVEAVLKEIAGEKLRAAEKSIVEYYQALVERPDFEAIRIDADDHEVYAVSGGESEKVITFFNQGDMNCAALSIFLALGGSSTRDGGPAFLILDDPSQSLDSEQKRKLAALIDRVAADKQVLLATMDEELLQFLREEVSKAKTVYRFGDWDPVYGPSFNGE